MAHVIDVPSILRLPNLERLNRDEIPVCILKILSKARRLAFGLREQAMRTGKSAEHLVKRTVLLENHKDILHFFLKQFHDVRGSKATICCSIGHVGRDFRIRIWLLFNQRFPLRGGHDGRKNKAER